MPAGQPSGDLKIVAGRRIDHCMPPSAIKHTISAFLAHFVGGEIHPSLR